MKSYLYMELFLNPGEKARKTTDCTSWGGVVSMAHADRDTLEAEVARLRAMERQGLFVIEE
jgi:hypothetical protein